MDSKLKKTSCWLVSYSLWLSHLLLWTIFFYCPVSKCLCLICQVKACMLLQQPWTRKKMVLLVEIDPFYDLVEAEGTTPKLFFHVTINRKSPIRAHPDSITSPTCCAWPHVGFQNWNDSHFSLRRRVWEGMPGAVLEMSSVNPSHMFGFVCVITCQALLRHASVSFGWCHPSAK